MDRTDVYRVYELGAAVRPLAVLSDDVTLNNLFMPLQNGINALRALLGTEPQAKMDLSRDNAQELSNLLTHLDRTYFADKDTGDFKYPENAATDKMLPWHPHQVRDAVRDFEAVFRADMQAAATYWAPKRGSYNTRDLVDSFEECFLPELRGTIGDIALGEYRSSGRCFAFGLWSAAGYHACRAVEAVLRAYYTAYLKREPGTQTWGQLIGELRDANAAPKAPDKTLFYLTQLKDSDRNPLMHVRVVLDEGDADILIASAKVIMVLMARELIALRQATPVLQAIEGGVAVG